KSITGLFKMLSSIKGIDEVTFTTNGLNLDTYAEELYSAGVRRFNISLDSLDPQKYHNLTGGGNLDKVIKNILLCKNIGYSPIKMNVVALKGINDGEIFNFIDFASQNGIILRFIELMDITSGAKEFFDRHFISINKIKEIIESRYKISTAKPESAAITGAGPAVYYAIDNGLKIGFISPVTDHFCANCNRLRLTANGILKSCLLRPGEINLMKLIREGASKEELQKTIKLVFDTKEKACGKFCENNTMFSNMSQIGG
ncbi:MAG TPA: radical SAM protein, partial [Candidatus Wallbacteria bacterium]|nr:radical SAM protein [Candidatus Wallbacteria bacterium]